jgi:putative transposase
MLPREFPPWLTVYYHFRKWHREGTLARAHDLLRGEVREREGRKRDPSAAIVDSQVAKTTGVGGPERGYDGAKRVKGRKRHILVDTGGLLLSVTVHGADLHDREGGRRLMSADLRGKMPPLELVWADGAYAGRFGEWAREERGWRVEVVHRPDRQTRRYGLEESCGFRVVPRRWVVERTFAWLGQARRLAKDYERLPETAVAMIMWAMSRIMLRMIAGTTAR